MQTTQAHNARLFADIRRQRAEVESLVALLQKVLDDVDAANAVLEDGGVVGDLAGETRAVEGEMAAVAAVATGGGGGVGGDVGASGGGGGGGGGTGR